jgi:hypothetical protein
VGASATSFDVSAADPAVLLDVRRRGLRLQARIRRCRRRRGTARARHRFGMRNVERIQQRPTQRGMLRIVVARNFLILAGITTEAPEEITDVVCNAHDVSFT